MMKSVPLHVKIIIGLISGVAWAFVSSALGWNEFTINWIDPFGEIFIRMLKFISIPLVLFSIVSGISGLTDITKLGKLGVKTLAVYMTTTFAAVVVGLVLVNLVKPGSHLDEAQLIKNRLQYEIWRSNTGTPAVDSKNFLSDPQYADEVAQLTENRVLIQGPVVDISSKVQSAQSLKQGSPLQFIVDIVPDNIFSSASQNGLMLQIIFFALFFGVTMMLLPPDKSAPIISMVNGMNEVFLKMILFIMRAAPFFVFALLAGVIARMADSPTEVFEVFKGLGSYSLTLVIGLAFMLFVFYPLMIKLFVRKVSYKDFFKNLSPAQFLAFSTSSSAATLPVTMECVEENMGVSKNVSSFVLPIGATVNMDGTSLQQGLAVVFLAQMHMVDLSITQQLTIVLTAMMASIGASAVPSAGLVLMIAVLQSVGLNPAWVAIIFPVDRILDMCRTVINVTGDATVATLIAHSEDELDMNRFQNKSHSVG